MTKEFACPYLGKEVELTEEREKHIQENHPGLLPDYLEQISATLADPDQIRSSIRDSNAFLFSKWFDSIRTGRYMVVVTVRDTNPLRYWIVTAYTARKLTGDTIIWQKN